MERHYSRPILLLGNLSAFIFLLKLYSTNNNTWIPLGIMVVTNSLIFNRKLSIVLRVIRTKKLLRFLITILIIVANLLIIYISILGLNIIIDQIFTIEDSLLIMPRVIISILIIGSGIGLIEQMLIETLKK